MGIEFIDCMHCGKTFTDSGEGIHCSCGHSWCEEGWKGDKCAIDDGYNEETETCKYCRKEAATDDELFAFLLKDLNVTRKYVLNKYLDDGSLHDEMTICDYCENDVNTDKDHVACNGGCEQIWCSEECAINDCYVEKDNMCKHCLDK